MTGTISVESTAIRLTNLETRLPFEFGIVRMTGLPHCFVSVELAIDGSSTTGLAADHFPPRWLTKDPDRSLESEADAILEVVQQACEHATAVRAETVFDGWKQLHDAQRDWAAGTDYPPLLWNFGVTFVERAMIDAYCRHTDTPFPEAVRRNTLGIEPEAIYPELAGAVPADYLPAEPARTIAVRHTVGHGDPLRDAAARPEDGLPYTLAENIAAYGLERFKIKITGDVEADHERVRNVLSVIEANTARFAYTLDANEQYRSVDALSELLDRLRSDPAVGDVADRLLFVEQPFPREVALSDRIRTGLGAWEDRPPVVIDESDGPLDSFGRALERGYDGTSVKNCKGVFKGLINACLAGRRRERGASVIISGEDLTTIGPVSLQQDLATMATLGLAHVERNGHHYFRGLSMFEPEVQAAVHAAHDDLFRTLPDGTVALDIDAGRVALDSVVAAPFGYAAEIDPTRYDPPDDWTFAAVRS